MSQSGSVALVTGASSGIGQSTAMALASAGYRVFGTSRQPAHSDRHVVTMVQLDVTRDAGVDSVVRNIVEQTGRIDLLVNNAGIGIAAGAEESSVAQAQALFDTNLFGVIRTTLAVLPHMRRQGSGRIVNISSVLGFLPAPFMALYAASKHAVEGYTESLDHEVREWGIRALLVEPAYTATRFDKNTIPADQTIAEYEQPRERMQVLLNEVMTTADDPDIVASAVLEAASAEHPKLRYQSGKLARRLAFLRRFAPTPLVDRAIRKQVRLRR